MRSSDFVRCFYSVAPGMQLQLSINDVPLAPSPVRGSYSKMLTINHRLIEGENEVRADLEPIGDAGVRAVCDAKGISRFSIRLERPRDDDPNTGDLLLEFNLNGAFDGVAEPLRRYPLSLRLPFDPQVPVRSPSYVAAEPVGDLPCEGTEELRAFVQAYFDHTVARRRDELIELSEPFMRDLERAYPGRPEASRGAQLAQLDEFLADDAVFAPLEPEQLHFETRAAGRVVVVSRLDGQPVMRARCRDENAGFQSDLLVIRTRDGWRVM